MSDQDLNSKMAQLPPNILEAFIPGYAVIQRFVNETFSFDITLVVTVCALLFGLNKSLAFIWKHAHQQFETHCMSSILISDFDLREQIIDWIAKQNVSKDSRRLTAASNDGDDFEDLSADCSDGNDKDDSFDVSDMISFSNCEANTPPKYVPSFGEHWFFYRGRFFILKRHQKQFLSMGSESSMARDEEELTFACVGRSTDPIKALIQDIRQQHSRKGKSCTTVRRPAAKHERDYGRNWKTIATRPSRPMHTVVLDPDLKQSVLEDINEYLQPATRRWYAHRGIPYRRGYLLHGPPGCGKSSLAWAIAGVFGLPIYCISMVDPNLTEEHLSMLFTALPQRCVVLLEDIDSAGLGGQRTDENASLAEKSTDTASDASKIGAEIAKALAAGRGRRKATLDDEKTGITLSGLLNAIDGVASHEGRILVMTTNFPDKLDNALIRPGRVDMKVEFTYATKGQMHELFTRMYSPEEGFLQESRPTPTSSAKAQAPKSPTESDWVSVKEPNTAITRMQSGNPTPPNSPKRPITPLSIEAVGPSNECQSASLEEIASRFADVLPENTFTPAEIQGFLLRRKRDPWKALKEAGHWRDDTIAAKLKVAKGDSN